MLKNTPQSKDFHFAIMYDTEKLQILTFEKLKLANVLALMGKNWQKWS